MRSFRDRLNVLLTLFEVFVVISVSGVHSQHALCKEIVQMGAQCDPFDNCRLPRDNDQDIKYNCNCERSCLLFDTCCIDSPYRSPHGSVAPTAEMKCRRTSGSGSPEVYMIDYCKNRNLPRETLCESDPEEKNDPLLMLLVISLKTGKTYKNYFCAICNEDTGANQLHIWDVQLTGRSGTINGNILPDLTYDKTRFSWYVVGEDMDVYIKVQIPDVLKRVVKKCVVNLISNCSSNWTDVSVRQKCAAYMAQVAFNKGWEVYWYRNPHCAKCNFRNIKAVFFAS
ncbi:uncharacterized protein NPIL_675421 [Nephila pilipes]|uniref:SMB domain-containing protein n=1 Tax=Nephila pilipes TaxID=299642 RepID=A0A8X6R0L3_NEPPI|nr:uncharacterized protein NPIL_675421 [Nephila pilipes]